MLKTYLSLSEFVWCSPQGLIIKLLEKSYIDEQIPSVKLRVGRIISNILFNLFTPFLHKFLLICSPFIVILSFTRLWKDKVNIRYTNNVGGNVAFHLVS